MSNENIQALLFKLAGAPDTLFAINLFKVLEIVNAHQSVSPALVKHPACKGVAKMRDQIVPIIDLSQAVFGVPSNSKLWLWCEFARRHVAFEISDVLQLVEVPWASMEPSRAIAGYGELPTLTGVLRLEDGALASMLDIDEIANEVLGPMPGGAEECGPVLSGKTVLFADDSRLAREQVKALLIRLGADVIECTDGEDAVQKLAKLKTDPAHRVAEDVPLVVTDIEMPRRDGYSLVRQIKGDPLLGGIKIVMYSSLSADQSQKAGLECGADEVIAKFSDRALGDAIARLVH